MISIASSKELISVPIASMLELVSRLLGGPWTRDDVARWGIGASSLYFLLYPKVQTYLEYAVIKHNGPQMLPEVEPMKRELFSRLEQLPRDSAGNLVFLELGISYGANIGFYPRGAHLVASDIHAIGETEVAKKCEEQGLVLDRYLVAAAEDLSAIPDNSVSAVVTTHVTCSMAQMDQAMREIKRVLMPGGEYLFVEHTREHSGRWGRHLAQLLVFPLLLPAMYCNCRLDQLATIRRHFPRLHASEYTLPNLTKSALLFAVGPHIYGSATKL